PSDNLSEASRQQLAEHAHDLLVAQRTLVALDDGAQDLRLALRTIVLGGLREPLHDADLLRAARALGDQLLDPRVDLVDALAEPLERRLLVLAPVGHRALPANPPTRAGAAPRARRRSRVSARRGRRSADRRGRRAYSRSRPARRSACR